jgi:hypothetical protein
MREIRLSGSEGGGATALPTPIHPKTLDLQQFLVYHDLIFRFNI